MLDLKLVICCTLSTVYRSSRQNRGIIFDGVCEISFRKGLISTLLRICESKRYWADIVRRNLVADIVWRADWINLIACIWLRMKAGVEVKTAVLLFNNVHFISRVVVPVSFFFNRLVTMLVTKHHKVYTTAGVSERQFRG